MDVSIVGFLQPTLPILTIKKLPPCMLTGFPCAIFLLTCLSSSSPYFSSSIQTEMERVLQELGFDQRETLFLFSIPPSICWDPITGYINYFFFCFSYLRNRIPCSWALISMKHKDSLLKRIQFSPGRNYFGVLCTTQSTVIQYEKLGPQAVFEWAKMLSEGHYELFALYSSYFHFSCFLQGLMSFQQNYKHLSQVNYFPATPTNPLPLLDPSVSSSSTSWPTALFLSEPPKKRVWFHHMGPIQEVKEQQVALEKGEHLNFLHSQWRRDSLHFVKQCSIALWSSTGNVYFVPYSIYSWDNCFYQWQVGTQSGGTRHSNLFTLILFPSWFLWWVCPSISWSFCSRLLTIP